MRQNFIPIVQMRKLRLRKAKGALPKVICLGSAEDAGCAHRSLVIEAPAPGRCKGLWRVAAPLTPSGTPSTESKLGAGERMTTSRYCYPHWLPGSCVLSVYAVGSHQVSSMGPMGTGLRPRAERPSHGDVSPVVSRMRVSTPQLAKGTGVGVKESGVTCASRVTYAVCCWASYSRGLRFDIYGQR